MMRCERGCWALWLALGAAFVLGCGGYLPPQADQPLVRHNHPAFGDGSDDEECVDQAGWCSKLGHKVALSRCYRHHRRCCASCRRLALTIPHCPFGDKDNFCQSLGVDRPISDCYNNNHTCCHTCHMYDSGHAGCAFGDHKSWCSGIGHRYSVSSCYEHEAICCDTCSRFKTGIPGCPYGDRLQWCLGIGEYFPPSSCNANNQVCCKTCHDLRNRQRTTTIGVDVLREFFQITTTPMRPQVSSSATTTRPSSSSQTSPKNQTTTPDFSTAAIPHEGHVSPANVSHEHSDGDTQHTMSGPPDTGQGGARNVSVQSTHVSQTTAAGVTALFNVTNQIHTEALTVKSTLEGSSSSTQAVKFTDRKTLPTTSEPRTKGRVPDEDTVKTANDSFVKGNSDKFSVSQTASPGQQVSTTTTSVPITTVDLSHTVPKDKLPTYEKPHHVGSFLENQGLTESGAGRGVARLDSWLLLLTLCLATRTFITASTSQSSIFSAQQR